MSTINSIKLTGLATGMDTDAMVQSMLTAEQNKIDKAQQKEQIITWQQEIYREIISEVVSLNDKYFSITSKDSIISSSAWNTLSIKSSDESVITATCSAGASKVNYKFEVEKLAEPAKAKTSNAINGAQIQKNSKLSDLGLNQESTFKIRYGSEDDEVSSSITISGDDTIDTLMKKINDATDGKVKASYSEMTKTFSMETSDTGSSSGFAIVGEDGKTNSNSLDFLGLKSKDKDGNDITNNFTGSKSKVTVTTDEGVVILEEDSNTFKIDGIEYEVHSVGTSKITSKEDHQKVVDNMKAFVEDYNKLMDKIYSLVTEKTNKDYPPLTEAQREEMSEEEIEKWEKKAKEGLLRNDSEMRRFMDSMQSTIFGDNMELLNEMGLTSHENYNKKGQISLDEDKFLKALKNDSKKVYQTFAGDKNSVFEKMKSTMNNYVGGSSSIFAKKAGLEKTASFTNNYYSEQLKKQADLIKKLQNKFNDKETALYKKFAALESSMNKLNNQMSYFMQS